MHPLTRFLEHPRRGADSEPLLGLRWPQGERGLERFPLRPGDMLEMAPQELRIALLLAEGRATREAGSAVFLSPKTIEYHLRSVYRKLDITSRDELAAAMKASPSDRPSP